MSPDPYAPERCAICQKEVPSCSNPYNTVVALQSDYMWDKKAHEEFEGILKEYSPAEQTPIQKIDQWAHERDFCSAECLFEHLKNREESLEKDLNQQKDMRTYYRDQISEIKKHPFNNFGNYFKGKVWISRQFKETVIKSFIWLVSVYLMAHLVIYVINR